MRGQIAVAHNGNLTNAAQLRDELETRGLVFQTTVDSEIIIMMLAQPTLGGVENSIAQTLRRIEGAYSLVIMTEKELIGARDPYGFRPLSHRPRWTAPGCWRANRWRSTRFTPSSSATWSRAKSSSSTKRD